jgi:hypothetical protein
MLDIEAIVKAVLTIVQTAITATLAEPVTLDIIEEKITCVIHVQKIASNALIS